MGNISRLVGLVFIALMIFSSGVCVAQSQAPDVEVVSDTSNFVVERGTNAVLAWVDPEWTAQIDGASWIWADNPTTANDASNGATYTFRKTFDWSGLVNGADFNLQLNSDNGFEVLLNGHQIATDQGDNNFMAPAHAYSGSQISQWIVQGQNTLEIKVTNYPWAGSNGYSNPAGLIYKFTIKSKACTKDSDCPSGICEGSICKAQIVTSVFPDNNAGIAAYIKLEGIDVSYLAKLENYCDAIEKRESTYVIGIKKYTFYVDPADTPTTVQLHAYLDTAGWAVVYLSAEEESTRIFNWDKYYTNPLENNILKTTMDDMLASMDVTYAGSIKYYDFAYPNAKKMAMVKKTNGLLTLNMPGTVYEGAYAFSSNPTCSMASCKTSLKLDDNVVAEANTCHLAYGRFDKNLLESGTHSIEFTSNFNAPGSGMVFVTDQEITANGADQIWSTDLINTGQCFQDSDCQSGKCENNLCISQSQPSCTQPQLKAPWEGTAIVTQGNNGYPTHHVENTWDNQYALDVVKSGESNFKVLSPANGVVYDRFNTADCGNGLVIEHKCLEDQKFYTVYCHLSDIKVSKGEVVEQGNL